MLENVGDDNQQRIADRAGFDKSNLSRWKKGARPDVEFVVRLARAYGANVLDALVASDYIEQREAGTKRVPVGKRQALSEAALDEILEEIRRRAK